MGRDANQILNKFDWGHLQIIFTHYTESFMKIYDSDVQGDFSSRGWPVLVDTKVAKVRKILPSDCGPEQEMTKMNEEEDDAAKKVDET